MGQKRALQDLSTTRKSKKPKIAKQGATTDGSPLLPSSKLALEEVDFPRGGGTSFTPIEVKAIRVEAMKEADKELFEDSAVDKKTAKPRRRKSESKSSSGVVIGEKSDGVRIEHLNYKRINVGMKILGQIVSIQPLVLIISLPNQLFAHVPITHISTQLTSILENMEEDDNIPESDEDIEEPTSKSRIPDLVDIFHPGQYVRSVVTAVHAPGSVEVSGLAKSRDEVARASRRVELSLVPTRVNTGVQKADLKPGFTLSAAVKSVEDHGYILDLGVPDVSGFLSFADSIKGSSDGEKRIYVGQLLDVTVEKMSSNGRSCHVGIDSATFSSSSLSEVARVTSVLPGALVQSLITAVHPTGITLQILGFFEGTVERLHLRHDASEKAYKVGKKVKARILYDVLSPSPKFALALSEHILRLGVRQIKGRESSSGMLSMQEAYPVGTILDAVKVIRVEGERGAMVEVEPGLEGFVHISHTSDEYVPSLAASGSWTPGSLRRARVIGYLPFDGLLQLSMKPSIFEQKFLQVDDVQVGQAITGTIKKLTESGLFVSISGNIDGVVWPNHYADIALKHPSKRFKEGANIKCRVLAVDSERKRVFLTAKKALLDSTLPILSKFEDAKIGSVAHAVVFNVSDRHLIVEFFDNLKAIIPAAEASETPVTRLSDTFAIGRVVKVRVIAIEPERTRIVASIRQASSSFSSVVNDITGVEIGDIVEGLVSDIHKDNAVLTLQPTRIRALISLNNLANHRGFPLSQLKVELKAGDKLEELVVVTRNPEKGIVIVANKPKVKPALLTKGSLSIESVSIGQIVGGRITRHTRHGALVKLSAHVGGTLHPTDTSDNYEAGIPFPAVDSILKATIVRIDQAKKQVTLSTRHSRMYPDQAKPVVDREINGIADVMEGETVRGFIKSVAEHGLFVTIGRDIDARVQIRELFDEYVKDWKSRFETNQLVKGRILSVDLDTKKVEMSFRSGDLGRERVSSIITDIQEGQKVAGVVKRIEDYGLFIQIDGSKFSGLCHKSELSETKGSDVVVALRNFREGDRVKAVVLGIDKRRISLSLKPSHFANEDFESNEDRGSEVDESEPLGVVDGGEEAFEREASSGTVKENITPVDDADEDEEDHATYTDMATQSNLYEQSSRPQHSHRGNSHTAPTPSLKLSGGFHWFGNSTQQDYDSQSDSSSDESNNKEQTGKKKRKRKEIEQDLTANMHAKTPESNADFERLLLGSPNSSYLWVQYMSFQLQLSEVEKAREIAKRALRTINFREEQEKLNVWIALLNLENAYGTEETLDATFKEAARANDSKTVHLRLAFIFDQAEKHEKAEEQYKHTCKKFGQSSKVWTLFGEYYLRRGNVDESRKLLPRSLQSLDKRKHLKTISRFALQEYKLGDPERGKTIFEGIVDSHPKRWDMWSIYIDMEAGQGDIQSLRNLFDRVLSFKMTSHKAKSFFKKWLEMERRLGDDDGAEAVKQKAAQWIQRANLSE